MDSLHLSIALGPLAIYFLVLGLLNLTPRPFLTTGARDWAVLGLAVSGFVVVGPMELFFPENAATTFGTFAWALMLALYGLFVLLTCLLSRPRLVIYNLTADELRGVLDESLPKLDADARWAGDNLLLPNVGVQAHLEPFAALKNVQIVASGPRQNYMGWRNFELHLATALRPMRVAPNPYGITQLFFAGVMVLAIIIWVAGDQQAVAQSLHEMLRW
jgi:hypothetical protein